VYRSACHVYLATSKQSLLISGVLCGDVVPSVCVICCECGTLTLVPQIGCSSAGGDNKFKSLQQHKDIEQ